MQQNELLRSTKQCTGVPEEADAQKPLATADLVRETALIVQVPRRFASVTSSNAVSGNFRVADQSKSERRYLSDSATTLPAIGQQAFLAAIDKLLNSTNTST